VGLPFFSPPPPRFPPPPPPRLGEHTAEILAEVGVDEHRLEELIAQGAV
jgi:crotonobetainyl-CoA:carnitine CoA-transferase CaiB-like acyl-CoA transferase